MLRQNRRAAYCDGTCMSKVPAFAMKYCPVNAFSGLPPSAGGLKRGSRQVPVHVPLGSIKALAWVSLYDTSVRYDVFVPSIDGSQRVFQNTSLPREEREVHAGVARRFDVGALRARPVLVVTRRDMKTCDG